MVHTKYTSIFATVVLLLVASLVNVDADMKTPNPTASFLIEPKPSLHQKSIKPEIGEVSDESMLSDSLEDDFIEEKLNTTNKKFQTTKKCIDYLVKGILLGFCIDLLGPTPIKHNISENFCFRNSKFAVRLGAPQITCVSGGHLTSDNYTDGSQLRGPVSSMFSSLRTKLGPESRLVNLYDSVDEFGNKIGDVASSFLEQNGQSALNLITNPQESWEAVQPSYIKVRDSTRPLIARANDKLFKPVGSKIKDVVLNPVKTRVMEVPAFSVASNIAATSSQFVSSAWDHVIKPVGLGTWNSIIKPGGLITMGALQYGYENFDAKRTVQDVRNFYNKNAKHVIEPPINAVLKRELDLNKLHHHLPQTSIQVCTVATALTYSAILGGGVYTCLTYKKSIPKLLRGFLKASKHAALMPFKFFKWIYKMLRDKREDWE